MASLPPITELTSSEDEVAAPVQPVKKAKACGRQLPTKKDLDVRSLMNQVCQCSRVKRRPKETCFVKFKNMIEELQTHRTLFRNLHKLDQDQVAPRECCLINCWLCFFLKRSDSLGHLTPSPQKNPPNSFTLMWLQLPACLEVFERLKYSETDFSNTSAKPQRRKHFLLGKRVCGNAWRKLYGLGNPVQ